MKKKAIAIITTILLSIPIFMDTPLAEAHGPNNIVYTPYGTCTSEFYYDEANDSHNITLGGVTIPQKGPVNLLRYTFTHPYTGTFDLDITISGILSNRWQLMTSNCYLVSVVDETTLRFAVNNATYCEIAIMPQYYNNRLVLWLKNQNLTPVEDTTTAVNDILTHVSYIDGQIQQIQANTQTIRNLLLSTFGGYVSNNGSLYADMQSIINAMNSINLSSQYNNIPIYSYPFYRVMNMHNSLVNGYELYQPYYKYKVSDNPRTFDWDTAIPIYTPKYYLVWVSYGQMSNNYTILDNTGANINSYGTYNVRYYGRYYYNYIYFENQPQNININLIFNDDYTIMPVYIGSAQYLPIEVSNLMQVQSMDSYILAIDRVTEAVRSMSVNVNNLTVNATGITYNVNNTQVDNSVNTYNTNINHVYNVENNFGTQFDNYNQQFTPDFTETMTTIQSIPNVMNDIVVNLYGLPFIKYPLLITLAGIVLIALLGV